jgi:hypothetical protein
LECVSLHVATRHGGPTEMPSRFIGFFPGGMISRTAFFRNGWSSRSSPDPTRSTAMDKIRAFLARRG